MRWKVTSVNTTDNQDTGIRTTTKTKQLSITVGEAVGMGKTAYGAVQAVAKSLKSYINQKKNSTTSTSKDGVKSTTSSLASSALAPLYSTASTLATVVKGLEAYKKVMSVVEKVTPAVQLAARASGCWCSPGNAGDIGQIILGKVQQILISLAVSTVSNLKDYVWNYEFAIKEIREEYEEPINKNIEELSEELSDSVLEDCINNLNTSDDSTGNQFISDISSGNIDLSAAFDWNNDSDTKWFSDVYVTEYTDYYGTSNRKLRGSLKNLGIQYSDDDGETWTQTKQEDGNWTCFAKIKVDDAYIYVAGSKDFISSLKDSEDSDWVENKNYYYDDGYNIQTRNKYYKENNSFDGEERDEYEISKGIYYSLDNGITWQASNIADNINCFCEFEEKPDYPTTIVAGSDDFNGCYYTEDGKTWSTVYSKEKWLDIDASEEIFKRINNLAYLQFNKVNTLEVCKGSEFSSTVNVTFSSDIKNLEIADARDSDTQEYFNKLQELIKEGKTIDEIYEEIGER